MYHFEAIGKFELELQTENPQFGSKLAIFVPYDLDINLEICQMALMTFSATSNIVHDFVAIGKFKLEWQTGNSQLRSKLAFFCPVWPWICQMTFEK